MAIHGFQNGPYQPLTNWDDPLSSLYPISEASTGEKSRDKSPAEWWDWSKTFLKVYLDVPVANVNTHFYSR